MASSNGITTSTPADNSAATSDGHSLWNLEPPLSSRQSNLLSLSHASKNGSSFSSISPTSNSSVTQPQVRSFPSRCAGPPATLVSPRAAKIQHLEKQDDRGVVNSQATVRRMLPNVQKDADDPTTPPPMARLDKGRRQSAMVTSISRLFATQDLVPPEQSQQCSHMMPLRRPSSYSRTERQTETAALPDHIYTRGLLEGRHSDITIHAFGRVYKPHRLILDQSPFFHSALSGPWIEANVSEITLHPEDIDPLITQESFELALKRLYGRGNLDEEEQQAAGLLATGSWLEMPALVDSAVDSLLRSMTVSNLSSLIRLVTNNYYGPAGDKIMVAAKSMLCRDGWRMPLEYWDEIPGEIVREIVGGDSFFVDDEWERWVFARKLLDYRLRQCAGDLGLIDDSGTIVSLSTAERAVLKRSRFDATYRLRCIDEDHLPESETPAYKFLYSQADVEPLLSLLDDDIYYIHLDFEQLQVIRNAKDVFDVPVVHETVVADALWQQMELRQRVVNASDGDEELGISKACSLDTSSVVPGVAQRMADSVAVSQEKINETTTNDLARPRKFWIPCSDRSMVVGASADEGSATFNTTMPRIATCEAMCACLPQDTPYTSNCANPSPHPNTQVRVASNDEDGVVHHQARYTNFPPFRFATSFPNSRLLKEKKRVYSRTMFYAGSLWNIYIQKVVNSRGKQLGVYLHRTKECESGELFVASAIPAKGSVDQRIGQLEREMLMNGNRNRSNPRRQTAEIQSETELWGSTCHDHKINAQTAFIREAAHNFDINHAAVAFSGARGIGRIHNCHAQSVATYTTDNDTRTATTPNIGKADDMSPDENQNETRPEFETCTIPPYIDGRPTIKTYFKIYSPSRGGRMLSVYESAPDTFNFSQSWGWKSSTLMLDEGMLSSHPEDEPEDGAESFTRSGSDGKLRFMVVIGNV